MLTAMATSPMTSGSAKPKGKSTGFRMSGFTSVKPPEEIPGGWRLKPAAGRIATAIGLGIFTVFWNGITWTILIATWRAEHGLVAGGVTLFIGIFVLIGLVMAWAFVHQLLKALFTPAVILTLNAPRLTCGTATELSWAIPQHHERLSNVAISLVLREECQYRRGTDTVTDRHDAQELTIYERSEPDAEGRCTLLIPATLPPSFNTTANQLVWSLRVTGTVKGLPDVDDEYPLAVDPALTAVASLTPAPLPLGTVLPADSPVLALANGGIGVVPGVPVAGVVCAPGKPVTVRLRWATSGKGDQQGEVVATTNLVADAAGFILVLPSLPPLWHGTVLSLTWHVDVEVHGTLLMSFALSPAAA